VTPALARLRLLRFSNFGSPICDVLTGFAAAIAAGAKFDAWKLLLASLASACVYHSGMIWNDVADRREDAATRPHRPIPSGGVSLREAVTWGLLTWTAAIVLSILAGNWRIMAPLAIVVLAYDLAIPRGNSMGPVFLGVARGLNLLGGYAAAGGKLPFLDDALTENTKIVYAAAGYAASIAGLSFFALGEDRPWSAARAAGAQILAFAGLAAAFLFLTSIAQDEPNSPLAAALCWIPWIEPLSIILGPPRPWTPDRVGQVVGAGLRGTFVFNALACVILAMPQFAVFCGIGYVAARVLARWIPPT
jgi:4-hydroxybenzoate polyprenyltransferase